MSLWQKLYKQTSFSQRHKDSSLALLHQYNEFSLLFKSFEQILAIEEKTWIYFFYRLALLKNSTSPAHNKKSPSWFQQQRTFTFNINELPTVVIEAMHDKNAEDKPLFYVYLCAFLVAIPEKNILLNQLFLEDDNGVISHENFNAIWTQIFDLNSADSAPYLYFIEASHLLKKTLMYSVPLTFSARSPLLYKETSLATWNYFEDDALIASYATPEYQKNIQARIAERYHEKPNLPPEETLYNWGILPSTLLNNPSLVPFTFLNIKQNNEEIKRTVDTLAFQYFLKLCQLIVDKFHATALVFDESELDNVAHFLTHSDDNSQKSLSGLSLFYQPLREKMESHVALILSVSVDQVHSISEKWEGQFIKLNSHVDSIDTMFNNNKNALFSFRKEYHNNLQTFMNFVSYFDFNAKIKYLRTLNKEYFATDLRQIQSNFLQSTKLKQLLDKKKFMNIAHWSLQKGLLIRVYHYVDDTLLIIIFNLDSTQAVYDLKRWKSDWSLQTIRYYNNKDIDNAPYLSYDSVITLPNKGHGCAILVY